MFLYIHPFFLDNKYTVGFSFLSSDIFTDRPNVIEYLEITSLHFSSVQYPLGFLPNSGISSMNLLRIQYVYAVKEFFLNSDFVLYFLPSSIHFSFVQYPFDAILIVGQYE